MKAHYSTAETSDTIEYEAIVPTALPDGAGFVLLGFDSWEDAHDEKLAGAITGVLSFKLDKAKNKVGFGENTDRG
jgi:hypothetical protein